MLTLGIERRGVATPRGLLLVLAAGLLAIAGCGGGGGGSSSGGTASTPQISLLAGNGGGGGSVDGTGTEAGFGTPMGLATDSAGNVYVADIFDCTIRKVTTAGVVTTLAGTAGVRCGVNAGTAASFSYPSSVATDSAGNVYVAEFWTGNIRRITSAGVVTTQATGFNQPIAVATDSSDNVYVADMNNNAIRKITPAGAVTTLAGTFNGPLGVATDSAGNVYVADTGNTLLKKVTPAGVVTTLATTGGAMAAILDPLYPDVLLGFRSVTYPIGIVVDAAGNIYVADTGHSTILKVTATGVVATLIGKAGQQGFQAGDLPGLIDHPSGLAISGKTLYFSLPYGVGQITNLF